MVVDICFAYNIRRSDSCCFELLRKLETRDLGAGRHGQIIGLLASNIVGAEIYVQDYILVWHRHSFGEQELIQARYFFDYAVIA